MKPNNPPAKHQLKPLKQVMMLLFSLSVTACATAPWPLNKVMGNTPEEKVTNAKAKSDKKPEETIPLKDLRVTQEKAVADLLKQADSAKKSGEIR